MKNKTRHKKANKKYDKIKLSRGEIKSMLSIFNHINIYNIENENTIWSEMLAVVDNRQSEKILNAKQRFINFSFKMEKKLRKISRFRNNESSYYMREKLMINGLVYLELIKYNEISDFNLEKLNFNKTTLEEYWEAKNFIRVNFEKIKENIEVELIKMFKKIAIYKRNFMRKNVGKFLAINEGFATPQKNSPESMNSPMFFKSYATNYKNLDNVENSFFDFKSDEEMQTNFKEYLKWKKFEVLEELTIFEDKENAEEENQTVAIENFLEDNDFIEFIKDLKERKKILKASMDKKRQEEEEEEIKDDEKEIDIKIGKIHRISENKRKFFKKETKEFGYLYDIPLNEEEKMNILKEKENSFNERMEAISSKIDNELHRISKDKEEFKRNLFLEEKNIEEKEKREISKIENINIIRLKTTEKVLNEQCSIGDDIEEDDDSDNENYEKMEEELLCGI